MITEGRGEEERIATTMRAAEDKSQDSGWTKYKRVAWGIPSMKDLVRWLLEESLAGSLQRLLQLWKITSPHPFQRLIDAET